MNKIFPEVFEDKIRNLQYRDTRFTKIPRAMRFNDRISMRASTELREPFLDHRLFELALRQSVERKIHHGTRKELLRNITKNLLPNNLSEVPKRPMQTPQREWLRGELKDWVEDCLQIIFNNYGNGWIDEKAVRLAWENFCQGKSDNSFYVWQWISLSMVNTKFLIAK